MRDDFHGARSALVAVALSVLLAACAPAWVPVRPHSRHRDHHCDGRHTDHLIPASTPDPAPVQTTAPGQHLDVIGTITALGSSIDVDGVTYNLTAATEVKGSLAVGEQVKLEYITNADGSRTVIEAKGAGFFDDSGGSPAD